ncbi:hypothetical protein CTA1_11398 [Colletotrichum tanaceti]|uniref:Uncharacterized protein n=1 Tax=Colletotrichum tanaceti TaxID=1306861 RepID=A0A4U6X803_9PEZI|nr:hypothetical protein CTA1_11398 [Colletotrichum tanaceti]
MSDKTAFKILLQSVKVLELADPGDVLVRPHHDDATPLPVDAIVLVGLAVALVVALVVHEDLVVVPAGVRVEGVQDAREVPQQLRVGPLRGVHREDLDDAVDRGVGRRGPAQEAVRGVERGAEPIDAGPLRGVQDVPGEEDDAEAAVRPEPLLEVPGARARLVEDLEAVEAHADGQPGSERLLPPELLLGDGGDALESLAAVAQLQGVAGLDDEVAGPVVDGQAGGEQVALEEGVLEDLHADALGVHDVLGRAAGEEAAEAVVELDQVLGDAAALALVRAQDVALGDALDGQGDLPAEVVGVLHRDVHALAGLGGMGVDGVPGEEDAAVGVIRGADSLSDLSKREIPRAQDLLGGAKDELRGDLGAVRSPRRVGGDLLQLDVEADKLVLSGDDHQAAVLGGLTEVGNGDDVHDTPDEIGRLSLELQAESPSRPAASAVAANDILGVDDLAFPGPRPAPPDHVFFLVVAVVVVLHEVAPEEAVGDPARVRRLGGRGLFLRELAQLHGHRVGRVVVDLGHVDLERLGQDAALDPDLALGVLLDVLEEEALDPALVQDDLLEAGEAHNGVWDPVTAADDAVVAGSDVGESYLNHVVGLLPRPVREAERVKDLQTAALETIGLAAEDLGVSLVDNAGIDAAVGHPCGRHQPVRLARQPNVISSKSSPSQGG